MKTKNKLGLDLALIVVLIVFQIFAWNFHDRFTDHFMLMETGTQPAVMALLSTVFFIVSGGITARILFSPYEDTPQPPETDSRGVVVLLILSLLLVTMKILAGLAGARVFPYPILRPFLLDLTLWIIQSEVPAFMAGLGIGWFIQR